MRERFEEKTGIYGLGINKDSFLGLMLPLAFVLVVGGVGWFLITR